MLLNGEPIDTVHINNLLSYHCVLFHNSTPKFHLAHAQKTTVLLIREYKATQIKHK